MFRIDSTFYSACDCHNKCLVKKKDLIADDTFFYKLPRYSPVSLKIKIISSCVIPARSCEYNGSLIDFVEKTYSCEDLRKHRFCRGNLLEVLCACVRYMYDVCVTAKR
jgi:hypothetical protein